MESFKEYPNLMIINYLKNSLIDISIGTGPYKTGPEEPSIIKQGFKNFKFDPSIKKVQEPLKDLQSKFSKKSSLNRTFTNLTQIFIRFKDNISAEDRQIAITAINDIHDRFLASMSLYHFSSYCQIRCLAQLDCTEDIFVHFYKFVQQFAEENKIGKSVKKFSLRVFLRLLKYVFRNKNASYIKNNKEMLYKNREMFKLFEDNEPRFISFEELVPDIYTKQEVQTELNNEDVKKNLKYINYLPGGKQLLQKWGL